MYSELDCCKLCPRLCGVNRNNNISGLCGFDNRLFVAKAYLHKWEEPPISGENGSGTIFFSGCNLKCIFCQNYKISAKNFGKEISVGQLSNIMLNLQKCGAHNINLVTPTHYILHIRDAIKMAKQKGLVIPIVYNSSGYENVSSIKLLDGLIDIYLPDLKYYDDITSLKYSKAYDYFSISTCAIDEMYKQVGKAKFDKNGIMKKGVIVRHLIIPGCSNDSKKILKYLNDKYGDNIYISIMRQYTPNENVKNIDKLNRCVTDKEYNDVLEYAIKLGINNCFIQDGSSSDECFVPDFDLDGLDFNED
ncbi:MAG: radical SAM protein [Bacilli bacterium]|nr:radical SAM protein [Bacilli bacterium]